VVQEPTTAGRQRIRIDGYRQTGGRVVEIADSDADFLRQQDSLGGIEGFVQDSLGTNPMSGVRVHLVGTDHEARTDAEGKFRLDGLEAGTYQISFGAPYTAAFGLRPEPLEREVFDGEVTAVLYRMPPVSDLLFEACRDERPPEGTGALMGRVVRGDASEPVAGIPVKVRWQEVTLTGGGGRVAGTRVLGFETETEEDGSYRFCSVPEDTQLSVFVELDGRDTEPDLVRLPQFSRGVAHTIVLP